MDVERTFVSLDREAFAEATRRLGHSLLGLALGVGVLTVAAVISGTVPIATPAPLSLATPIAAPLLGSAAVPASVASAAPTVAITAPASAIVVAPAPPAVAAQPAAPAVAAQPAPASKVAIATYRYGGRRYAGVSAEAGTTVLAARAATVQVRTYQLVDGDVRVGSNVPWLPFFPYVTLTTADGRLTYRPGALRSDSVLLVQDGDEVEAGAPLFRVVGGGASSWGTFYDASIAYNVVVSLVAVPSGADLDATPLIATR